MNLSTSLIPLQWTLCHWWHPMINQQFLILPHSVVLSVTRVPIMELLSAPQHTAVINPLFKHCTLYTAFWRGSGHLRGTCLCCSSVDCVKRHTHSLTRVNWHTHTHTHTQWSPWPAVLRSTRVYTSNTWWSCTLLRSQQSPPPLSQPNQSSHICPPVPVSVLLELWRLVRSSRRGSNNSTLQRWTRKGDCDDPRIV